MRESLHELVNLEDEEFLLSPFFSAIWYRPVKQILREFIIQCKFNI